MKQPVESPWKRKRTEFSLGGYVTKSINYIDESFYSKSIANMDVSADTKRVSLKVSPSVVSLVSRAGEKLIFMATGTIIESIKDPSGTYINTILTSASLLGSSSNDIKVEVGLSDGRLYEGQVFAYDLHYNLAIINIRSDASLPIANLRLLDDAISVDPRDICPPRGDGFEICPHTDFFNLCPGVMVIAIGRQQDESRLMVAPGYFSLDCCKLDCKELMRASCIISKSGVGGPLVNCFGEVIGVNFFLERYTPFMPINLVSKWLEHHKRHGRFCRPWLGMEVANLYAAPVNKLEAIIQNFPDISKGVIVEKVVRGSPASRAGILRGDVIVQCNKTFVRGVLEFFGKMWDKAGESVELGVIRKGSAAFVDLSMVVEDSEKLNSWPLPKKRSVRVY